MTRQARCGAVTVLCLLAAGLVGRAQAPAPGEGSRGTSALPREVVLARDLLLLAYPELLTREVTIEISTVRRKVSVAVMDAVDPLAAGKRAAPVPLITAVVDVDAAGELRAFTARGPLAEQQRNQALGAELRAHPGWHDADADEWVTRTGAKSTFDPGANPVVKFEASRWASVLKAPLQVPPAQFQWRDAAASGAVFRASPAWVAEGTAEAPDGKTRRYTFEFEPFAGRLVAVYQR